MKKRRLIAVAAVVLTALYWVTALWYTNKTDGHKDLVVFGCIAKAISLNDVQRDLYQYFWQFAVTVLLFVAIPKWLTHVYLKDENIADGNTFRYHREAFLICAVAYPVVIASTWFSGSDPLISQEYPLSKHIGTSWSLFLFYEVCYFSYFFSYEYFFRGWVSFGLVQQHTHAEMWKIIAFQTVLTTLFHIGKPIPELLAAAAFGPIFGFVAFRYGTIWYGLVIHYVMNIFIDYFSLHGQHLLPQKW